MNLKNDIKAILLDVDKTLVDRQIKMAPTLKETLIKLKNKGYLLGINSGRPVFSSIRVLEKNDALSLFDYFYGCNGLEFYDLRNKRSTYLEEIDVITIKQLDKLFYEDYLELAFYKDEDTMCLNHMISDETKLTDWTKARFVKPIVMDFETIDYNIPKLVILFKHEYRKAIEKKIMGIHIDSIDIFFSGDECLEVVPKGINKGNAVSDLANKLNIGEKAILTCGDSENDIPALVKGTGVFVGNNDKKIAYSCSFEELGSFLNKNFQL